MTNRTCPISSYDCHACEHWHDLECCHKDALCPVCGMTLAGWEEMTGETAHAHIESHRGSYDLAVYQASKRALIEIERLPGPQPIQSFSGRTKASELNHTILQSYLGEWYEKGYRLVMGEDIVTLYYAGYDDIVFVFGRETREMIPSIHKACYLHNLKMKEGEQKW